MLNYCLSRYVWILFLLPAITQAQTKGSPNIIFIMVDDMGYADISSFGCKDYKTPHIDQLASEGMRFTQAYSAAPVCTPSRVGYMTGKYPARNPVGLREPLEGTALDSLVGLKGDQPTLASILQQHGYETVLIGKWHLGLGDECSPNKNGFNEFFGFKAGAVDFVSHINRTGKHDLYENDKPVKREGYLTDILAEKAISFLNKPHDRPFFLSIQFNAPHWPWQAPGDPAYPQGLNFKEGGSASVYAAMMTNLDANIGKIDAELKKLDLASNTLVLFISDNGGEKYSDMGPLKGSKFSLWEGGIRVPAIARWPKKIKAGSVNDQPIIAMDWTVTMLAVAGVRNVKPYQFDGINLIPYLKNDSKKIDRIFYWRVARFPQKAIRDGKWKYVQDENGEYLFDMEKDIGEKNNLKDIEKAWFETLKKKYQAWEATVLPIMPYPQRNS